MNRIFFSLFYSKNIHCNTNFACRRRNSFNLIINTNSNLINFFCQQAVADRALRTVAEESQKLRTRLEAEGKQFTPKIEATIKQVNEAVVKTAQDLKTQAEAALNTISKKN